MLLLLTLAPGAPARIPEFMIASEAPKALKVLQLQKYSKMLLVQNKKVPYNSSALFPNVNSMKGSTWAMVRDYSVVSG